MAESVIIFRLTQTIFSAVFTLMSFIIILRVLCQSRTNQVCPQWTEKRLQKLSFLNPFNAIWMFPLCRIYFFDSVDFILEHVNYKWHRKYFSLVLPSVLCFRQNLLKKIIKWFHINPLHNYNSLYFFCRIDTKQY